MLLSMPFLNVKESYDVESQNESGEKKLTKLAPDDSNFDGTDLVIMYF